MGAEAYLGYGWLSWGFVLGVQGIEYICYILGRDSKFRFCYELFVSGKFKSIGLLHPTRNVLFLDDLIVVLLK